MVIGEGTSCIDLDYNPFEDAHHRSPLLSLCEEITASSSMPVARAIRSNNGSIKMASVSFIVSFPPLYVILAFPLCKNGLLLSFSGETTYPYT